MKNAPSLDEQRIELPCRAALRDSPTLQKLASYAQQKYQEAIKEAKQESWHNFTADIDSVPEMSRVNKILKTLYGPSRSELNQGSTAK